jgi:cytochrome P450
MERRRDPLKALERLHRKHPGIARLDTGVGTFFLLVEPAHLRHVLVDNARNFTKETLQKRLAPVFGRGLFTNDGPSWARQRKLVQPAFHRERLVEFSEIMLEKAQALADRWAKRAAESGEPVDVGAAMTDLTLDVAVETLLGSDAATDRELVARCVATLIAGFESRSFADRLIDLVPLVRHSPRVRAALQRVPTGSNLSFAEALEKLDGVVYRIIAEKRRRLRTDATPERDVVSLLLRALDEEKVGMTDQQVRDEVMTLILTGHETSAWALSWTFVALSHHPEVDGRVAAEVRERLGGSPATAAGVARLEYTARVVDEALRLYTPIWRLSRTCVKDDVIDGCPIPAGSTLIFVPYFTHRLERIWHDPERFDPDRFLPERVATRERMAHVPFGAGPRSCIGESFAMLEILIILSTVLRRVRLSLVPGERIELDTGLSLRSKKPLWMRPALRTESV